jgi:hypothetical protein
LCGSLADRRSCQRGILFLLGFSWSFSNARGSAMGATCCFRLLRGSGNGLLFLAPGASDDLSHAAQEREGLEDC